MRRDDQDFLSDMLAAAKRAVRSASRRTYAEFMNDEEGQLAIFSAIITVGEAASRVSSDFRKARPEISWRKIVGMRNHLVHGYFNIDLLLVWDTANNHLPELIVQLEPLISPKTDPDSS